MRRFYLCFIFFVLFVNALQAQTGWPPVYEIKIDTAYNLDIDDKYWQLLEDPSGKLTIDQVSSPSFTSKFHANTTRTKGYDYNINTYWLRYRFKNTMPYPVKLVIPERIAYAWLYTPKGNNKWIVQKTGVLVPWSERDGLKRFNKFLVSIQPGKEMIFYEKNVFDFNIYKPKVFQFRIGYADAVIKKDYLDNDKYYRAVIYGVIVGILLLAAFINMLFYRIVREKVYLYFSLYIFFNGLYYFIGSNDVLFREQPTLRYYIAQFSVIISFFVIAHFIRYFLSTRKFTPVWDKFLIMLSYLVVAAWVVRIFTPPNLSYQTDFIISTLTSIVIYIYFPIMLGTLIFFLSKNKKDERIGIFALMPLFVWLSIGYTYIYISYILFNEYKIPYTSAYTWMLSWGSIIELVCFFCLIIMFSWILFKRYQDMQLLVVQSSLDKERLAKEKEMERSQLIEQQKTELERQVESRTSELKQSLEELKTTQSQLIQSEKMASLGELTAGIAHEIQNPLNFVNNFSEVSMELIEEVKSEKAKIKSERNEELENELLDDISQNLQKISHHGKRADSIVKGMLQHSRASSNIKEPTDINKLADEYFRLAYHGLRAKDKSFNAEMVINFDTALPLVAMVPQDIGRVMLNLFTNAFYATQQRLKADKDFKPEVKLSTLKNGDFIEIKVWDNGTGIPDSVKGKILQPFFTTKPTGEGTGLGLSLSYDIVVKGHEGKIEINSKEGEYTEFIISIPG